MQNNYVNKNNNYAKVRKKIYLKICIIIRLYDVRFNQK